MGYIRQLKEDLIKKIAAGEVIERPSSVVKELVENSIDANATRIEIEIERGAKSIKVRDNGIGIDPSDIPLLFTRHATSKLKSFDQLWNLDTLGFRGEALASISAVSKITCNSKHINQECGFELKIVDGKIEKKSCGISIGTIFEIDDLFYNLPTRRKFLKSESTEISHVSDVVTSLALSHPRISFLLSHNKNTILKSNGSNDLKQTILELLGNDLNDRLISLSSKNNFLELSGYISTLEVFRSDRKSIFVFVNNRPVRCQVVMKAVLSAYEGILQNRKYPVIALYLNFKPTFVDINVHPTKKEVRYTHPNNVYSLVLHSVQDAISNHYKKEYKEKSAYLPPEITSGISQGRVTEDIVVSQASELATWQTRKEPLKQKVDLKQVQAAIDFYNPHPLANTLLICSIENLKCKVIYSGEPIANITKIGNKSLFEVGSIFDEDLQVVFSGEIVGDGDYQKAFFNNLSELAKEIYKSYISNNSSFQKKIISQDLEQQEESKEVRRKKPPKATLYKAWKRDNWTCVYCGKQLLDPEVVKSAIKDAKDAFVTYLNNNREKVTTHLLREHTASYDHYLAVSKLPQFSFDLENLFACCFECNRKKSDSIALKTWEPMRQNNWDKPLSIAGLHFVSPYEFSKIKQTV